MAQDLALLSLTLDDAEAPIGDGLPRSFEIQNLGDTRSVATVVQFELLPVGGGDPILLSPPTQIEPLDPNERSFTTGRIAFPDDTPFGDYRLRATLDPNGEIPGDDDANDVRETAGSIAVVDGRADLRAAEVETQDATLEADAEDRVVDFTFFVENVGAGASAPTTALLSLAPVGGGDEIFLDLVDLPSLPVGLGGEITNVEPDAASIPADLAVGEYRWKLVLDPENAVPELNELNNVVLSTGVLTIVEPNDDETSNNKTSEENNGPVETSPLFSDGRDVVALDGPGAARALGGNDEVRGGSWKDEIFGQAGSDDLFGFGGQDKLYGGAGKDELFGGAGPDRAWGGGGKDLLDLGGGADRGWGGGGADVIRGDGGDDVLRGGGGNDVLRGGGGADKIVGGGGRDRIFGDRGDDDMRGGAGRDVFVIARKGGDDVIRDFRDGDRVDLSAFDFASFGEVARLIERDGRDAVLDLPGRGEVTFLRTRPGEFDADDFIL